ncbi:Pol polyprotein, partial [Elysia marginata]
AAHYFEPPINQRYCSEILWRAGEDPQQCRSRPSQGGTKCWRHDENRRTDATAARHRWIQTALANRRNNQQIRQNNERQKQLNKSRFGFCTEILWHAGENPRQCKSRPSRGGTKCWRHDEGRLIDAKAARHQRIQTALTNRRNDQQWRQNNERQKQLDNSCIEYLQPRGRELEPDLCLRLTAANGLDIPYSGYILVYVFIAGQTIPDRVFLIIKDPPGGSRKACLLGMNIIGEM